jgi:hypothetical protein
MPPQSTAAPNPTSASLDGVESAFVRRALRRRPLFLGLSIFGIAVAAGLSCYYVWRRVHDPLFPVAARAVNRRAGPAERAAELRQYRFAGVLGKVLPADFGGGSGGPSARA